MASVTTILTPESIAHIYRKIKEAELMSTKMIDSYGKYEASPNIAYTVSSYLIIASKLFLVMFYKN